MDPLRVKDIYQKHVPIIINVKTPETSPIRTNWNLNKVPQYYKYFSAVLLASI